MAFSVRLFRDSKWLYGLAAVALIVAIVTIERCPLMHSVAADFSLPVVSPTGQPGPDRMRLADQRGKVVLLDFWATWCAPCQASTPVLVRLAHRFRSQGLVVMGINVDEDGPGVVPAFARRFGMDYPILYDNDDIADRYNVHGLPTVVLIDRTGRIQRVHVGLAVEKELAEQIEELL